MIESSAHSSSHTSTINALSYGINYNPVTPAYSYNGNQGLKPSKASRNGSSNAGDATPTQGALGGAQSSDIYCYYSFLEVLGHGAYGTVARAQRKDTGAIYAIKHIDKRKAGAKGLREVYGEVETMTLLAHPNVVRLEETYQDSQNLWIVMEYMGGGELAKLLKTQGRLAENIARRMVMYIIFALQHIHNKGFVHRDIKPANILIANAGEPLVKLADFGFAVLAGGDESLRQYVGTAAYMAPEIVLGCDYGKPVDMWALGVVLFQMLSGELPFVARGGESLDEVIVEARISFHGSAWASVTPGAKDFIASLLQTDTSRRATADSCLAHHWLQTAMTPRGELGAGRRSPKMIFRGAAIAVVAAHRLLFWARCRALRREGADIPLLRSLPYLVGRAYNPPSRIVDGRGRFLGQPRALVLFLRMLETSSAIDTLDLSHNGIDSLEVAQHIVRTVSAHPSLTSLNLDHNPLPPLIGRALVRLARGPTRLRTISLVGTPLPQDVISQVATGLREKTGGDGGGRGTSGKSSPFLFQAGGTSNGTNFLAAIMPVARGPRGTSSSGNHSHGLNKFTSTRSSSHNSKLPPLPAVSAADRLRRR